MKEYRIRAHHGMCFAFFEGRGYSSEFTEHMGKMKELLAENPVVTVIAETDDICAACPNNEAGTCTQAEKVSGYDRAVLSLCGLKAGVRVHWQEFEKTVDERILTKDRQKEICGDCQWDPVCSKNKISNLEMP